MAVQRKTTAGWAAIFTPPAANDLCIDTDLLIHKIGDGVTMFTRLPIDYVGPDLAAVIAGLSAAGGFSRSIVSVTGAVTLGATANTDYIALIGAGGTPTLPTAVGNTNKYTIKNVDSVDHNVATTSSQTIEGVASPYVLPAGATIDVISDNTNWKQLS
jgi:hypothetical protein